MIIKMRPAGIRHVPVVFCSMCIKEIQCAATASFVYRINGSEDKRLYVLHNDCIENFEHKTKFDDLGSVPLECLPIYFMNTLGVDFYLANANANALSMI